MIIEVRLFWLDHWMWTGCVPPVWYEVRDAGRCAHMTLHGKDDGNWLRVWVPNFVPASDYPLFLRVAWHGMIAWGFKTVFDKMRHFAHELKHTAPMGV